VIFLKFKLRKRKRVLGKFKRRIMEEIDIYIDRYVNSKDGMITNLRYHIYPIIKYYLNPVKDPEFNNTSSNDEIFDRIMAIATHILKRKMEERYPDLSCMCSVCGSLLHNPFKYPRDFPNEYKICCYCGATADYIYDDNSIIIPSYSYPSNILQEHYNENKEKFDNIFIYQKGLS